MYRVHHIRMCRDQYHKIRTPQLLRVQAHTLYKRKLVLYAFHGNLLSLYNTKHVFLLFAESFDISIVQRLFLVPFSVRLVATTKVNLASRPIFERYESTVDRGLW